MWEATASITVVVRVSCFISSLFGFSRGRSAEIVIVMTQVYHSIHVMHAIMPSGMTWLSAFHFGCKPAALAAHWYGVYTFRVWRTLTMYIVESPTAVQRAAGQRDVFMIYDMT